MYNIYIYMYTCNIYIYILFICIYIYLSYQPQFSQRRAVENDPLPPTATTPENSPRQTRAHLMPFA